MSLKAVLENTVFAKVMYTVAASTIIGGGTVVLSNQSRIAVLESTTSIVDYRLERIETKIDVLVERGR